LKKDLQMYSMQASWIVAMIQCGIHLENTQADGSCFRGYVHMEEALRHVDFGGFAGVVRGKANGAWILCPDEYDVRCQRGAEGCIKAGFECEKQRDRSPHSSTFIYPLGI
jgi:hypothetical protein